MTRFALDAAALLELIESGRDVDPSHHLVAPASIRTAALDHLLRRVGAGELTEPEALALHERVTETKPRALNDRVSRRLAWDIARTQGWDSVRDAEYLAVAKLQADALVTANLRLIDAARGLVRVEPLDALVVS